MSQRRVDRGGGGGRADRGGGGALDRMNPEEEQLRMHMQQQQQQQHQLQQQQQRGGGRRPQQQEMEEEEDAYPEDPRERGRRGGGGRGREQERGRGRSRDREQERQEYYDDEEEAAGYEDDGGEGDAAGGGEELFEEAHPTDFEKSVFLSMLADMRAEGQLCDVSFAVQGHVFRAHRVVVSAASRWLRALLVEEGEDVVNLDIFDVSAFEGVLDYIYGKPLPITIQTAEPLLKIVRRLELQPLEQKIWSFLLAVVNPQNCMPLHELADRFDCPPLKLAAWRIIQQTVPGYALSPAQILDIANNGGSPDGGPGAMNGRPGSNTKRPHSSARRPGSGADDISESGRDFDEEEFPSIFASNMNPDEYVPPDQLPEDAPAEDVVRSWAVRLQMVWEQCQPELRGIPEPPVAGHAFTAEEIEQLQQPRPPIDYREALIEFYTMFNPHKLPEIDDILKQWRGREDDMITKLYEKYEVDVPEDLAEAIEYSRQQRQLQAQQHENMLLEQEQQQMGGAGEMDPMMMQGGGRGGMGMGADEYDEYDDMPPQHRGGGGGGKRAQHDTFAAGPPGSHRPGSAGGRGGGTGRDPVWEDQRRGSPRRGR